MGIDSAAPANLRERLSALSDGELDGFQAEGVCTAWASDPAARSTWHAYHLIGDVLRSQDLAADPARDAALVSAVMTRLASEPASHGGLPKITSGKSGRANAAGTGARRSWSISPAWSAPLSVAASFLAMAGLFMFSRSVQPPMPQSPGMASLATPYAIAAAPQNGGLHLVAPTVSMGNTLASDPGFGAGPERRSFDPQRAAVLVRDARLDAYLAAHKQFAGSTVIGLPPASLRNATVESMDR
jgi:sigma-E factor negative regulatory protein RseA